MHDIVLCLLVLYVFQVQQSGYGAEVNNKFFPEQDTTAVVETKKMNFCQQQMELFVLAMLLLSDGL